MTVPFLRGGKGPRCLKDHLLHLLLPSPASTFLFREDAGRLVLVDCSLPPLPGRLAVLPDPRGGFLARPLREGEDLSRVFGPVSWILRAPR